MKIVAVGRMRPGPEEALVSDYLTRFDRIGRGLGLGPLDIREIEAKKSGMNAEADLISKAIADAGLIVTLDERGKSLTSPDFATTLANWRDQARGEVCFIIGGADGIATEIRAKSDLSLSFGKMVWPHMLVRVMLTEQLYRAASILAGAPYHRE